ncbi:uncharacterized protein LOC128331326 [Hemicordylus capensis]|uniref:uncharacterized protein LOC128331326 n=1 Tax=Hemicordylus capensis TaxID=884348 RepID=UPI002304C7F6|nr:uncharacterized protein LOC128331326 [Hemicordylus capensis]
MADRKKPSGAQFRKRKAERAKEDTKQEVFFRKYLCKTSTEQKDDSTIGETTTEETPSTSGIGLTTSGITSEDKVSQSGDIPVEHTEETEDFEETESTAITTKHVGIVPSLDYSDPANWPNYCIENLRQLIVQHGPRQIVSYKFPKDSQKRKFSPVYYKRKRANGEEMCRHWLIYSTSKDVVFCFCCRLFSKRDGGATALQDPGSKDWKNIGAILSAHERSTLHLYSYQAWRELELRLQKGKTIDNINQQKIREEEQYWRQVLERLIAAVRFLGMQNMAFHGTTEKLYSENNGNFLKLVEFLALFDPVMTEHVRRVKDEETMVHYLGKEIQNELIELLATSIKQNILARINSAKYYSVILDCTPDVSHTEQMTMIVRFVDVIMPSDTETSEPEVTIKEHFLGFVPLKKTTCAFMAETLLWLLEQMGLPLENLRGQGYDNGSNMRGKEHGVQKRVLDINPRAFFVPCSAHSLNLVVNDAAKSCREATGFFMITPNQAKSSWVPVVEGHYEAEVSMGIHVSGARDPTGQVQFLMKGDWEKPTEHLVHAMFWKEMGTVMEVPAVTKNLFVDLAERVALSLSVTNCYVCADTKINDQGKAIEEITDRMRKLAHVPA